MKKRLHLGILLLFGGMIIFFTLFGHKLHYSTKAKVELITPTTYIDGDEMFLGIPKSACIDGKCYVVVPEAAFNLTLYKVVETAVELEEPSGVYDRYYKVVSGLGARDQIVLKSDRKLKDGDYVILK